jgi:hypothetical protein
VTIQSHGRSDFCHNCGIRLFGKYCAACGQKALPLSVTLHDFFHELTHETLHLDGRVFQTIRRLLLWPGFLTREYIQGRRARWISPIRLYLVCSVAYFALSSFTGFRVGVYDRPTDGGWRFRLGTGAQAGITAENEPDAEDEAKKLGFESFAAMRDAVNHAILVWVPRVMFVLMPLFAWLVALAYRGVDRNYLHHLIFAVHVHAAWFAAAAVAKAVEIASSPIGQLLEAVVIVFGVAYTVFAFRRVYGSVRFAFARIAVVLTTYFVVYILVFAAIVIPVVFRQVLNRPPT